MGKIVNVLKMDKKVWGFVDLKEVSLVTVLKEGVNPEDLHPQDLHPEDLHPEDLHPEDLLTLKT